MFLNKLNAFDTFDVTVINVNSAPMLLNSIPDLEATEDSLFTFRFNRNTFYDEDPNSVMTYEAFLSNGDALPAWFV